MKAIIFNSGLGSRLEELTEHNPKCLVKLYNKETILHRQIRLLSDNGIKDFIISTGPFKELVEDIKNEFPYLNFTFVHSDKYNTTNYIYSFYLMKDLILNDKENLDEDYLMLHGDLVFNDGFIKHFLEYDNKLSYGSYNKSANLPEKDFKCLTDKNLELKKISVKDMGTKNVYKFQPFYRFHKQDLDMFINKVIEFIEVRNISNVYAEEALNELLSDSSNKLKMTLFSINNDFIEEIDNKQDLEKVNYFISYSDVAELTRSNYTKLFNYIDTNRNNMKFLLVISKNLIDSSLYLKLMNRFYNNAIVFTEFSPNPIYEEAMKGLELFNKSKCDLIVTLGGGSAIDVGKSIKYYSNRKDDVNLVAIPSTAGTGSEETKFAVIYKDGKKTSLDEPYLKPNYVFLEENLLNSLPSRVRISTLLDSYCQAIESVFSKNATNESFDYAIRNIHLINLYGSDYLKYGTHGISILRASNYSGKAINLTYTTAPHALSYKITSMFRVSHGEAVARVFVHAMKYITYDVFNSNFDKKYVDSVIYELSNEFKDILDKHDEELHSVNDVFEVIIDSLIKNVETYLKQIEGFKKLECSKDELTELVDNVNLDRLKNFIYKLEKKDIENIYSKVFKVSK